MKIAYIFFNGEIKDNNFYKNFIEKNRGDIYCADGGANICYDLALIPNEIWGDLDSIKEKVLDFYKEKNILIKKFPKEKDKTDSELILENIKNKNYEKIYCIGTLGGAIEHELTNINLLFKYENLIFLNKNKNKVEKIFRINNKFEFKNCIDSRVSFIIFSDRVEKISLKGFKYNLDNESFTRGDTRLISNIIIDKIASINFLNGKILCVLKNKIMKL